MIPTPNPTRPGSVRESRILRLLSSICPPLRHQLERRWQRQLPPPPPIPPEPRHPSRIGDKEWETSIQHVPPTCLDRKELELPESGPTRCSRTGLVLARGRCPSCIYKPKG